MFLKISISPLARAILRRKTQTFNNCLEDRKLPVYNAPAKINLGLKVGRLREDGYHSIETFLQTVSLYDEIEILSTGKSEFSSCDYNFPENQENLCQKAYRAFCSFVNREFPLSLSLRKRIPVGAGLGGGSSDAAAVIKGINEVAKTNLSVEQMCEIGAGVGSDVPFFIKAEQGSALCTGRGEIVHPREPIWEGGVVIVFDGMEISTKEAYKSIDDNLTNYEKNINLDRYRLPFFPAKKGLKILKNDFTRVVFQKHRKLAHIVLLLQQQGAVYSNMSGSGSAVFGLFNSLEDAERVVVNLPDYKFKAAFFTPVPLPRA